MVNTILFRLDLITFIKDLSVYKRRAIALQQAAKIKPIRRTAVRETEKTPPETPLTITACNYRIEGFKGETFPFCLVTPVSRTVNVILLYIYI